MADIVKKKKNTTIAIKDKEKIKKSVGGGKTKKVEQI